MSSSTLAKAARRAGRSPRANSRFMPAGHADDSAPALRWVAIVGASSGVGRALAEELAAAGVDLLLVATDQRDLDAAASDLRLRFGITTCTEVLDLRDAAIDFQQVCLRWWKLLGGCDALLCPAGYFSAHDDGLPDAATLETTLRVNFSSIAALLAAFGHRFEQQGHGTMVAFSSIAAAVPRRRRMAYTAAKAALETFAAGLRHHFADSPVRVQTYALGYVDTAMISGQKLLLPAASPAKVARHIVQNLGRDVGTAYLPGYWWAVTRVLRACPWWLFRRLRF